MVEPFKEDTLKRGHCTNQDTFCGLGCILIFTNPGMIMTRLNIHNLDLALTIYKSFVVCGASFF